MAVKNKKKYAVVYRDGRYVRKAPNTFAEKIVTVKKGDEFIFLNEVINDWYKVKVNRKIGWIHSSTARIVE